MTVANRRRLEREQRRALILDAAQKVFDEHGLAAATMEQVAAAAELSKGSLYLHFRSKDELFMGLAADVLAEVRAVLAPIAADEALDGLTMFGNMATAYSEIAMSRPNTVRNSLIWHAGGDMVDTETDGFLSYRRGLEEVLQLFGSALLRGQKDGTIRPELDPLITMMQFWPSLAGAVVMTHNSEEMQRRLERAIEHSRLVPGLIDIFLRGIAICPDSAMESES